MDTYGMMDTLIEENFKRRREERRNIRRDEKGRLKKGARLAQKDSCDVAAIWLRYTAGMSVKEIVESRGCSKSTVYKVLKQQKEKQGI